MGIRGSFFSKQPRFLQFKDLINQPITMSKAGVLCVLLVVAMVMCVVTAEPKCNLPMKIGPCKAFKTRWYYNKINNNRGFCEEFQYGGCDGNGNNFKTKALCEAACRG